MIMFWRRQLLDSIDLVSFIYKAWFHFNHDTQAAGPATKLRTAAR
jgi:hypothetical protein